MTKLSMMLLGVIAVATGIALALTMPREGPEPAAQPAPVQKGDLAQNPPPIPAPPSKATPVLDPVDPAVEAADLEDGSGS